MKQISATFATLLCVMQQPCVWCTLHVVSIPLQRINLHLFTWKAEHQPRKKLLTEGGNAG